MRLSLLLFAALVFAACDSPSDTEPLVFQGVTVDDRGDASLSIENGALVVSGLDGTRSGGFTVDGTPSQVDVEIDPLAIDSGDRFGVTIESASGAEVASFYNVGQGQGRVSFEFFFTDALPVVAAAVTYRLGGRTGRIVGQGYLEFGAPRQGRLAAANAGTGEGSTGSTHVVRENGRYVVVSDSNGSGARSGGCAGFLVTPPTVFEISTPICTDWIEVEPIGEFEEMPVGEVSVTARGVGSFTVNDLTSR